ncbi:MAG: YopT-type cysteine protease domain-containing protein [Myxococcota bacterium]
MPPRFKDHHKSSYYKEDSTSLIDSVERLCGQANGTMTVGFSQEDEKLAERVGGGGVCYALVKGWLSRISRGNRGADTYAALPVRADVDSDLFKSVLRDQLISYAIIHRANNYSALRDANPWSGFKAENVAEANKNASQKRDHIASADLDFVAFRGTASDFAVDADNQSVLCGKFAFRPVDFKADGNRERYITYVRQHMEGGKPVLQGITSRSWLYVEHEVPLASLDSDGKVTEVRTKEQTETDFRKRISGAIAYFAQTLKSSYVLIGGGTWKPAHAVGFYVSGSYAMFFDPNFGVFEWDVDNGWSHLSKFVANLAEVYEWGNLLFVGFGN